MFTKATPYPSSYYQNGIKVTTFEATRYLAHAKTLNYLAAITALQKAKKKKAVEAIYIDRLKNIYEGTTSNFFAVINDKLITPKEGVLIGITRRAALKIANKLGIIVLIRNLNLKEVANFQEAFITASNKEIMPVARIDDKIVGNGKVGQVTKKLMEEFRNLTQIS